MTLPKIVLEERAEFMNAARGGDISPLGIENDK
jgi:hypothetical protein